MAERSIPAVHSDAQREVGLQLSQAISNDLAVTSGTEHFLLLVYSAVHCPGVGSVPQWQPKPDSQGACRPNC